jgi:hypothetical protein
MVDYRIGETVKKAKGGNGVVRAIFTTMEGERCYAVEDEGALDFVDGASLARISQADLARESVFLARPRTTALSNQGG